MWFWQRREVYMGPSGPRLDAVRAGLEKAGIACDCLNKGGHNFVGADRLVAGARSAGGGLWYVYVHWHEAGLARELVAHILRDQ